MSIITIDGPASSGKGTVAKLVAAKLGFHYLDSGIIYRALGLMVRRANLDLQNTSQILRLVNDMHLRFDGPRIVLNDKDETEHLRAEEVGMMASAIAPIPEVRSRLLNFQRSFAKPPGLVTDGRDMGSVVFPEADLKVFLTASPQQRALRRYSQLQNNSDSGTIEVILRDINVRDKQDSERSIAPLGYDSTYRVLDNSDLSVDETVQKIINWYKEI